MKEVKGKTLTILHRKVMKMKADGWVTVGGIFKSDDGYTVIMSRH